MDDGIPCRSCGASYAQPDPRGPFCKTCMNKFFYQYHRYRYRAKGTPFETELPTYTENDLNSWLALQLKISLKHMKTHGFAARCEKITQTDVNGNAGYQCPHWASTIVNGRHICELHRNPPTKQNSRITRFVEQRKCPYKWIEGLIAELCALDDDFNHAVQNAAKQMKI